MLEAYYFLVLALKIGKFVGKFPWYRNSIPFRTLWYSYFFFLQVSSTSCPDVLEFLFCYSRTYSEFLYNFCPADQFLVLGFYHLTKLIV